MSPLPLTPNSNPEVMPSNTATYASSPTSAVTESMNFLSSESVTLGAFNEDNEALVVIYVPKGVVDSFVELKLSVTYSNSVAEVILVDQFGNEITSLAQPMEICLVPNIEGKRTEFCLAFYNESTEEWECEDYSVDKDRQFGLFCGTTDHLTNFALLLHGLSSSSDTKFTMAWISLAFVIAALLCVLVSVILIEVKYRFASFKANKEWEVIDRGTTKLMEK